MHRTDMIPTCDLRRKADQIRENVLAVAMANGAGHIAPSLSCVDILTTLYYRVMDYRADDPLWDARDRLIFSKSHGCYGLYAILADLGPLPAEEWHRFYTPESSLKGCPERRLEYGIEAGCGALGHGLPMAVGLAYGAAIQGAAYHTYCVVGDGELQEGSNWEALLFAVKHRIEPLTVIVDHNRLQAMDFTTNVLDCRPDDLARRLAGFGLTVRECDGHDPTAIVRALSEGNGSAIRGPRMLIAHTTKGYGLKCMENKPRFHFRLPTIAELKMGKSYADPPQNGN